MDKVKRSKDDIMTYLKEANICQNLSPKALEPIAKKLSEISNKFNPESIRDFQELITCISGSLRIRNSEIQDTFIQYVTGYSVTEIEKHGKGEEDKSKDDQPKEDKPKDDQPTVVEEAGIDTDEALAVPDNEPEISLRQGVKNLYNKIADSSRLDFVLKTGYAAVDLYQDIRGISTLGNLLKGVAIGYGATSVAALGAVAITTLKVARWGVRKFVAAKDTLAKAMHNKAIRDIATVEKGLEAQKKALGEISENGIKQLDESAAELGFIGENGEITDAVYKMIVDSRTSDEPTHEECEDALTQRFTEESERRDSNISMLSSQRTIKMLKTKFSLTAEQAFEIIQNVEIGEDNEIHLDESYGIDLSVLTADEKKFLINASKRDAKISVISESAKREAIGLIEVISSENGPVFGVKSGVDIKELPADVRHIVNMLHGRTASERALDIIKESHSTLDFLADCESELLTRIAVKANEEMSESVKETKGKVQEQKGFLKSASEGIKGINLKIKAKSIVEKRQGQAINSAIKRNDVASAKLISLAQERLQVKGEPENEVVRGKDDLVKDDSEPAK